MNVSRNMPPLPGMPGVPLIGQQQVSITLPELDADLVGLAQAPGGMPVAVGIQTLRTLHKVLEKLDEKANGT